MLHAATFANFSLMQKMDARKEILDSIRRNLAASLPFDAVHHEHHAHKEKLIEPASIVTGNNLRDVPLIERFRENLISISGN